MSNLGQSPSPRSAWRPPAIEAGMVVLLLTLGLLYWPRSAEGWSTPQDHLFDGLDAGEWADQARAFVSGAFDRLDGHRMPTWTILTGGLAGLGLAEAGHRVNHVLQLLLGPIVYGLGRAWGMGRGTSTLAAVLVATSPVLVVASRRFGVDPTVTTMVPLCLLAAHLVRVRWALGGVAGGIAALAAMSHFTTLPFPVPAAVSVALVARPGERSRALAAFAAGFAVTWAAVFHVFPWIGVETLLRSVGESASHEAAGVPGMPGWAPMLARGLEAARSELPRALAGYCARLHPQAPPPPMLAALAVLGLGGIGLGVRRRGVRRPGGRTGAMVGGSVPGWAGGLVLLMALAPVPVLLSMRAAERYSDNLLPIFALLTLRGMAVALKLLGVWLADRWPRVPAGGPDLLLGFAASTSAVVAVGDLPPANLEGAELDREVGALLRERAEPGGCIVSPLRDAVAYTDLRFIRVECPVAATEASFRSCLSSLRSQCSDRAELTWLVFARSPLDDRPAPRKAMDEWALRTYPTLGEAHAPTSDVWFLTLPLVAP